jgi:AcrR family transcriptional regulator
MKRQSSKQRKRGTILQAASALFSDRDFHLVLMDDVAARARVGKGTLYRYFPTKEELYIATVLDTWDRVLAEIEQVLRDESRTGENLETMTRRVLSFFWPRRHFIALLRDSMENPEWRRRHEAVLLLVEDQLGREDLSDGLPASDLRMVVELFLGMLRAALLYRDNRSRPETLAHLIVTLFVDGIRGISARGREAREAAALQEPAEE